MNKIYLLIILTISNFSCGESEYLEVSISDKKLKGKFTTLTYNGKKFTGTVVGYNKNQNLSVKGVIKDGKLLEYYNYWEDGSPKLVRFFKEGIIGNLDYHKNGKDILYYENGQIEYKRNYSDNKIEGEQLEYLENGELILKESWVDGKREGEFFYRGSSTITGNYNNGWKTGTWITEVEPINNPMDPDLSFPGKKIIREYDNGKLLKTKTIIKE